MSSKRSRDVRSSSQGEIGIFNHIQPIESPVSFLERKRPAPITISNSTTVKDSWPPLSADKQQCRMFTFGSPATEKNDALPKNKKPGEGFGEFLNACFLCKKKLQVGQNLYIYLGAFCSPECREDQMDLDGFEKEIARESSTRLKTAGKLFIK
ncbi:FCS-Like Zinc finger 2 isoform X2 [Manihot esculenta]|uniref:Uncharacterized protein n=2 Tax=Manihot esculenta TaxID=3983 RepID=A0ACB7GA18_MANES|nr:FCS-Like Zinc finger 2 isoform X2 [Manihot esculenta]KAG8636729.1 hypothetical protein MANES_15G031000v8 [Manihot esculenta]KAG8636730.1 hypothetical protein MANES_15G031000v8 [Manihot esculenta]